jgi:indoleacetamide hydrolase
MEVHMDMQQDWRTRLTRRHFIKAVAGAAPFAVRSLETAARTSLLELGARDAVERIRRGELKTEAYIAELLKQYKAHKGLNLVTSINEVRVLEAARLIDRARARGARLGLAAGLPFAVKDQIEVKGYPATCGNKALKGYLPKRNAVVVEQLVAAGAIPFCMTTLPDMVVDDGLMHQASPYSDSFGAVHNPYYPARVAGGSSGGSGAILAARIVPAALGADANGSIRCPAAFCGVSGLRPSTFTIENALRGTARKRYSDQGLLPPPLGRLYTIGPMARTVADVAFLDTLITGEPVPAVDLRTVRIGVPRPDYWEQEIVDPAVAAVIQQAFARLRDAGCRLVEIDLGGEVMSIIGPFENPTPAAVIAEMGLTAPMSASERMTQWLREHAPTLSLKMMYGGRPMPDELPTKLPPVDEQIRILTGASRQYAEVYRAHGIAAIAFPTIPIVAMPIRHGGPKEPFGETVTINGRQAEEGKVLMRNLFLAPRIGGAGLSLPVGLARGLPVGLELDTLPGHDSELLGLGVAIEKVVGRIPPPFS